MSYSPKFFNSPEDVRWLLETALRGVTVPAFKSFVLYGNEDAPERVDLYTEQDPNYRDVFTKIMFGESPVYCVMESSK